jgi:hypothetical protein
MKKLELSEGAFSHIFTMAQISDIILDKENKVFQIIIYDCPLIEMFLKEKFKYNSIVFQAQGWDNVSITLFNEETNETTEIETVEKTILLVFRKEADKTIFWGPYKNNGNRITITFTNLLSYAFYEKE